jgi:hypothetical protein
MCLTRCVSVNLDLDSLMWMVNHSGLSKEDLAKAHALLKR